MIKNNIKNKNRELLVLTIFIITLITVIGFSFALISNLKINDNESNQNSDKGLTCKVTIDQSTNVTFTWYRNGILNNSVNINCTSGVECGTLEDYGNIPNTQTIKNDVWICSVSFYNGTGIETSNTTANIVDTLPYEPRIFYNNNGSEIFNGTVNIAEDAGMIFNITSWDWDGDAITYILASQPSFCNITSISGILNCTPTFESDIINSTFSVGAQTGPLKVNSRPFNINVTPTNDAPRFSPTLINKNFTEGQKFNYYIIGVDDENNTPLNLEILDVTPYLNLTITRLTNTSFILMLINNDTITYSQAQANYTVTLNINDTDNISNNSKSTNASFSLIGISFNHIPNISSPLIYNNNSLIQGSNLNIYINATDIDNDELTFSVNNVLYPITYTSPTSYDNITNISFAYALINITNLTNEYVINHTFKVFVFDTNQNANVTIDMFINNTNDNPLIHDISNNSENSFNSTNISNLLGYTGVLFKYHVNASDVDDLTYDSINTGIRNYTTNDSFFYINKTTGVLEFTPTTEGNFTFVVTVTDGYGATYNKTASIQILLNRNPIFTVTPIIIYCNESDEYNWNYSCYYNISSNVTDLDSEDYITLFSTNSTFFNITNTTGIINFSVNQSLIGNNSILLNITDTYGGMNFTTIYIIINNTNNPPVIQTPNIPIGNFIVGTPYQITYYSIDSDLDLGDIDENLSYENLTFEINASGPDTSIFSLEKISSTVAILAITPVNTSYAGNYSINVTVTDYYGNSSSYHMFKYIYNITAPPDIIQIIPTGTPFNATIDNITWKYASNFTNMTTTINILENQTFIFNQTSNADNSSYPNSLTYSWYYDNSLVSTSASYEKYFDFFSNGTHNLTFIAKDSYYSNNSFSWIININNVNRPPTYNNYSIENLTVSGSGFIPGYLTYSDLRRRFYDPDDDSQNIGYTTDNTTTLVFSSTYCSYANFTFEQKRLNIAAYEIGECYVIFNATDIINNLSISSELILINVTNISEATEEPVPTPIQSGGGGTSNIPLPVPLPLEIERPKPLQLMTPKLVTVYKNATIQIPIIVNNTWNDTLVGIMLEAYTNSSNVSLYLDRIYIPKLERGESIETTLYVRNYKSEGHYEIQIAANVSVPQYRDIATIFINSAEMRSEGDELESKISFARDLLSSNPECQELNELLLQARNELNKDNYATTAKIITDVINGCKYLVNNAKQNTETPDRNFIKTFEWKKTYNDYLLLALFGVLFVISLVYILKKDNPEQNF
ncbi:MAG: hypothetical protein ACP5N1_05215 [Candidatus Woesearchaeota archaeon]